MSKLVANGLSHAVDEIRAAQPRVQAIYLFGSRAGGHAGPLSDLDLALLSPTALGEVDRWHLASRLSAVLQVEVDLVDLRRASAVMRVQVLGSSRLLFDGDAPERMRFEMFALSDSARLNEEREGFELLAKAGLLPTALAEPLKRMVGFRDVAVHDYRKLDLAIVEAMVARHLDELLAFARLAILTGAP